MITESGICRRLEAAKFYIEGGRESRVSYHLRLLFLLEFLMQFAQRRGAVVVMRITGTVSSQDRTVSNAQPVPGRSPGIGRSSSSSSSRR